MSTDRPRDELYSDGPFLADTPTPAPVATPTPARPAAIATRRVRPAPPPTVPVPDPLAGTETAEQVADLLRKPDTEVAARCRALLDFYGPRLPDATHLSLVGRDGLPIAVFGELRPDDVERSAAVISGLAFAASAATRLAGAGPVDYCAVSFDGGELLINPIGEVAVLGVLLREARDLGAAMYASERLVTALAAALDGSDLAALAGPDSAG